MFERATVLRKTQSLCPQCGEETISAMAQGKSPALLRDHTGVIEAEIVESGGQVFMRKRCKDHGEFEDLLASDAAFHQRMENLATPLQREYRPDEPLQERIAAGQPNTSQVILSDTAGAARNIALRLANTLALPRLTRNATCSPWNAPADATSPTIPTGCME